MNNITLALQAAAKILVQSLPHEEVTYSLFCRTGTYSAATATATRNEDTATVQNVVFAEYTDREIDGEKIRQRDRKVIIAGVFFALAFPEHAVQGTGATNDLTFDGDPDNMIHAPAGSFDDYLIGHKVILTGAAEAANNKQFTVIGVNPSTLALDGPLATEEDSTATVRLVRIPTMDDRITRSTGEIWEVKNTRLIGGGAAFEIQVRR